MPFKFQIDTSANVIRETWQGKVDAQQLIESCKQEWAHRDYRKGMPLISDFRRAEAMLSADEVLQFASWFSCGDTPSIHAIVVSRETGLDLASIYNLLSSGTDTSSALTEIFFSYVAAENWIADNGCDGSQSSLQHADKVSQG